MRSRWLLAFVLLGLVPTAVVFTLAATGSRAEALCASEGYSVASPSLWPPGARCAGGQPTVEVTMVDPLLVICLFILATGFGAAWANRPPTPRTRAAVASE